MSLCFLVVVNRVHVHMIYQGIYYIVVFLILLSGKLVSYLPFITPEIWINVELLVVQFDLGSTSLDMEKRAEL